LKSIDDGFQASLTNLTDEITRQNALIAARRRQLLEEFTVMEQTISQLQGVSSMLAAQFALPSSSAISAPSSQASKSSSSSQTSP
jgi:hypothetical protein